MLVFVLRLLFGDAVSLCLLASLGVTLCRLYWVVALVLYALKFCSPTFDQLTQFGKLQTIAPTLGLAHHIAFPVFYITASFLNALLIFEIVTWRGQWNVELSSALLPAIAFQIQALRRAFETLFVHHYSERYMSPFLFLSGLSFYLMAPMAVLEELMPLSQCTASLILKDSFFSTPIAAQLWDLPTLLLYIPPLVLFAVSSAAQLKSHTYLASMRERRTPEEEEQEVVRRGVRTEKLTRLHSLSKSSSLPTPALSPNRSPTQDSKYLIPYHWMFARVSCPHYLAEICIYFSLVGLSAFSNISYWLMFSFVVVNLGSAAYSTHAWYCRTFPSYPKERTALIPGIF